MINGKRIAVVMPAYNAAKTLEQTVRELPDIVDIKILVDDSSKDSTAALSKKLGVCSPSCTTPTTATAATSRPATAKLWPPARTSWSWSIPTTSTRHSWSPPWPAWWPAESTTWCWPRASSAAERSRAACRATSTSPTASHRLPEHLSRRQTLGISHRLPRLQQGTAANSAAARKLRRLRLRQPDDRPGRHVQLQHRRNLLPDQILQGSIVDQLPAQRQPTAWKCSEPRFSFVAHKMGWIHAAKFDSTGRKVTEIRVREYSLWLAQIERAFRWLARRPSLAVAAVGLTELLLRLAILPLCPIPEPFVPDGFSFLLAANTFASGRLTNPTPAMWTHFESFHITMQPTYMSMYFPAQGLILAAGKVLLGHPWFGLLLVTALMCAAICWMLQAWLPPCWALLGGMLAVLHLGLFSYWINTYFRSRLSRGSRRRARSRSIPPHRARSAASRWPAPGNRHRHPWPEPSV
jgi:hypothetical protein